MTEEELKELTQKIQSGTATEEEQLIFFKILETLTSELKDVLTETINN